MRKVASASPSQPFVNEAEHVSVRTFRKRLAGFAKAQRVVVVGGRRAPTGLFIPIRVSGWAGDAEILAAARRALRKVRTIERYRSESE